MCPESLHVYRRRHRRARAHDCQSRDSCRRYYPEQKRGHGPSGCERYAEILQHVSSAPREAQRAYAAAAAGSDDDPSHPGSAPRPPRLPPLQLSSPQRADLPAPAPAPPRAGTHAGTAPLSAKPCVGDEVLAPANLWPQYRCRENEGHGWSATVLSVTSVTALVHFTTATTRSGPKPYADERLPWKKLHQP